MSVEEFMASLPEGKRRCFRLTNDNECHRGFRYRNGVNQLPPDEKFNPSGDCEPGGLYFFTEEQLEKYESNAAGVCNLKWIRQVSFDHPDVRNARIYVNPGNGKCKCDKFFLGQRKKFFINDYVVVTPENVSSFLARHIRWTSELALVAVKRIHHYSVLSYIPETIPDYREICLVAVQHDGYALPFVPMILRDREMHEVAVKTTGMALQFVPGALRDEKMCLAAVQQDGYALQFVPEALRDREICEAAVHQKDDALAYVPDSLRLEVKSNVEKKKRTI